MSIGGAINLGRGTLAAVKTYDVTAMRKALVRDDTAGHFRPERARILEETFRESRWRQDVLSYLRDHIHAGVPRAWYETVIGHDAHLTLRARLSVKHFHATQHDPFTGQLGWLENVGIVSMGKVTTAFRDFLALMLVTDATTMGDYKFHEVGTDDTAEANSQTALIVPSGIARATGTQTNPSGSTYQSVATVTADATETWDEHALFNHVSAGTMMDRSLIVPAPAVVALDTVQFTYTLTLNAES